jgi:hypothetical protein
MSAAVTSGPNPLQVSRKFSFKNLRAYKTHPKQEIALEIAEIVPCMTLPRRLRFIPRPICPCNALAMLHSFLCFEAVFAISGRFHIVLGGYHASTHESSCCPATGFLCLQSSCRSDYCALRPFHDLITCSHSQFHLFPSGGMRFQARGGHFHNDSNGHNSENGDSEARLIRRRMTRMMMTRMMTRMMTTRMMSDADDDDSDDDLDSG